MDELDLPIQWTYNGITRQGVVAADWTDSEARYLRIKWDDGGQITIASRTVIPRIEELVYL